jgi:hypothetical protein
MSLSFYVKSIFGFFFFPSVVVPKIMVLLAVMGVVSQIERNKGNYQPPTWSEGLCPGCPGTLQSLGRKRVLPRLLKSMSREYSNNSASIQASFSFLRENGSCYVAQAGFKVVMLLVSQVLKLQVCTTMPSSHPGLLILVISP